jgi:hypothetical protein
LFTLNVKLFMLVRFSLVRIHLPLGFLTLPS